jgi:long-chain fatty acid transport protein
MKPRKIFTNRALLIGIVLGGSMAAAHAGGGYFMLGYGPIAKQMAGATTALVGDAYAGSSNPAKWLAAGNRVDIGGEFLMPYRRVERIGASGADSIHNFATTSSKDVFILPEAAFSRRVNDRLAFGVTLYGNGGLNTEYRGNNGVPGSAGLPGVDGTPATGPGTLPDCGNKPANFFRGCDKLGVDIAQLVMAPGVAYQVAPGHTLGVAPLIAVQRFEAYGIQAFAPLSKHPTDFSNRGWDWALGAGVRVGWLGDVAPGLTLGAAWSSRIYMDEFEQYDGLFADGALDIPENFSVGAAARPIGTPFTLTFDYQRINFGDVPAMGNGVLNTPPNAFGTSDGAGFNWENQNNYRIGVQYAFSPDLTFRTGYAYGETAQRDSTMNSVTFNMLAPNAEHQASVGFSWKPNTQHEFHAGYSHFYAPKYGGPSAIVPGALEYVDAHVNTAMVGWSWRH